MPAASARSAPKLSGAAMVKVEPDGTLMYWGDPEMPSCVWVPDATLRLLACPRVPVTGSVALPVVSDRSAVVDRSSVQMATMLDVEVADGPNSMA